MLITPSFSKFFFQWLLWWHIFNLKVVYSGFYFWPSFLLNLSVSPLPLYRSVYKTANTIYKLNIPNPISQAQTSTEEIWNYMSKNKLNLLLLKLFCFVLFCLAVFVLFNCTINKIAWSQNLRMAFYFFISITLTEIG